MTTLPDFRYLEPDPDALAALEGRLAVLVPSDGKLDQLARRVNRLTRGTLARFVESPAFGRMKDGEVREIAFPSGLSAEGLLVARLTRRARPEDARRAGAAVAAASGEGETVVLAGRRRDIGDLALGALLRGYDFRTYRTDGDEEASEAKKPRSFALMTPDAEGARDAIGNARALADAVYFTRDLVNEPANVLTTTEFARRLEALSELGVKVEVLDEDRLAELGMRALLAVGQGSESPSKVVVMEWNGNGRDAPLALVGKGVVFDAGGISLKPAQGMEEMTMDMGGAATVAGVIKALASRRAAAHVVGLVGLVENMPDGRAQRPGDVVRAMKGDTIEVINTDAEGRLVLADLLWYAQDRFAPNALIDLATLTGAIIIALGHENAGVFANDDKLAAAILKAAEAEREGAWRMPLGTEYAKRLKSRIADVKNTGGRPAGAVTAAEFLHRFVKSGTPWAHIDIAGVASRTTDTALAPKGATGWGVLTLNRMIADEFEA